MSRMVLNVVEEGIKSVGLEKIREPYDLILTDFYKNCCVIDPKKDYTPRSGQYSQIYSCFNKRRESSTLEINIDDNNIIMVKQFNNEFSNTLTLSPKTLESTIIRNNVFIIGLLTLEKKSFINYENDIKSNLDKLYVGDTIGTIESYVDDELKKRKYFSYNSGINRLSYYMDDGHVMEKFVSFDGYVKDMYMKFKATSKGSF